MTGSLIITAMLSTIILAAIGIRIAGGEPWKGAVLAVAFIFASIGASAVAQNLLLAIIAGAVAIAVLAGAMKIPPKQSGNALLGCIIGQLTPLLLM
ncbi:hypothetical protein [Aliiroseovarius lamellibrachiae]|uniref:hypothetical protein n=1 Tax=Aliiroseovarius lamellibrachiae TaxID=1924933 RepID=UPI001BDFDE8E|nr:hypothetical protein [Aliiroseovarius lamellibrachiae]MBT2130097.1 hypothetical protein [Aliiroseovarius lamellibrachiae]